MKEYIKFFKYDADYQLAKPNLPEPHAVYCWETNITDISKPVWNEKQYLSFKAVDGPATLTITNNGGAAPQLWYSYDQEVWTDWTASGYSEIGLLDGQKVYLKGLNDQMGYSFSKYSTFSGAGRYEVSGSITSIIDGDDIYGNLGSPLKKYMFLKLFEKNTCITKYTGELPHTNIAPYCYYYMFDCCASLVTAPELPATTLASNCYNSMFNGCTSLVTAPELPALELADYCYYGMFRDASITATPELPATTLAPYCYNSMFWGCKKLTDITELPALVLTNYCYSNMFRDTYIVTAPELPATTLASNCYNGMFWNCSKLANAPVLVAENLETDCYVYMFMTCPQLKYVETHAKEARSFANWIAFGSTTGTFKCYSTAGWTTGNNGIPNGWTVEYIDK